MDFSESIEPWSQPNCFIVADSQEDESQYSQCGTRGVLASLKALQGTDNMGVKMLYSPRKCDLACSQKSKQRQAAGNNSQDDQPNAGPSESHQAGGGQGPSQGGGGGAGNGGGGDQPGSGSGGGHGGAGGDGGGNDDDEEDEEQVEGQDPTAEEDQTPSSGSTNSGSLPALVPPHLVGPLMQQHAGDSNNGNQDPSQLQGPVVAVQGQAEGHPSSEESPGGGISDAPTAVVSDSDHRFSAPGQMSSPGHASLGSVTSPVRASRSLVAHPGGELSSTVSSMSSFSSTSSDEPKPSLRRKAPMRKQQAPVAKKLKLDTSTTSPETNTSSTSKKTTTSSDTSHERLHDTSTDTTADKSHDTSGDKSGGGSHDHPEEGGGGDGDISDSDMFGDDNGQQQDQKPGAQHDADIEKDCDNFVTPSEKLGSLHFSGQCQDAETVDDDDTDGNSDIVPPSQDAFDPVPIIIPSSPTPTDATTSYKSIERPRAGSSSTRSVQEWQPSFRSYGSISSDTNGRSRQASLEGGSTNDSNKKQTQSKTSKIIKTATEPLETQDLELSHIEDTSHVEQASGEGEDLRLHLTELDTCPPQNVSANDVTKDVIEISTENASIELIVPDLEPPRVHQVDSSSYENEAEEADQYNRNESATSPGLALRLSPTQGDPHLECTSSQFEDAEEPPDEPPSIQSPEQSSQLRTPKPGPLSGVSVQTGAFSIKTSMKGLSQLREMRDSPALGNVAVNAGDGQILRHVASPLQQGTESQGKNAQPSLTLDMIDTMTEEETQNVISGFKLDRPEPLPKVIADSEKQAEPSVFTKVREMKLPVRRESSARSNRSDPADPFEFSESTEIREKLQVTRQYEKRRSPKKSKVKKATQEPGVSGASHQEVVIKTETTVCAQSSGIIHGGDTLEDFVMETEESKDTSHKNQPVDDDEAMVIDNSDDMRGKGTASALKLLQGTYDAATQDYTYSDDIKSSRSKSATQRSFAGTRGSNAADNEDSNTSPKRNKNKKTSHLVEKAKQSRNNTSQRPVSPNREASSKKSSRPKPKNTSGKSESLKNIADSSSSDSVPAGRDYTPTSTKKKAGARTNRKILHYTGTVPRKGHVLSPKSAENTELQQRQHPSADPYDYRLSQSQHDRHELEVLKSLAVSGRTRPGQERIDQSSELSHSVAANMDTLPIHNITVPILPLKTSAHQSDVSKTPTTEVVPGQRHAGEVSFVTVKTVTEFRHTLTHVHKLVGGSTVEVKLVDNKVEQISHTVEKDVDMVSTPSPNRSGQTMTTGDLGDISSFSSSHFHSRPSSNHTSPAFLSASNSMGSKDSSKSSAGGRINKVLVSVKSTEHVVTQHQHPSPIPHVASTAQAPGDKSRDTTSDHLSVHEERSTSLPLAQVEHVITRGSTTTTTMEKSSEFGSAFSLDQAGKVPALMTKKSSSSSAGKNSEPLFSADNSANDAVKLGQNISKSTSSSSHHSESLFSRTSSSSITTFVKPSESDIPLASKRRSSSGSRRSEALEKSSDTDVVPPSEPDVSHLHEATIPNLMLSTRSVSNNTTAEDGDTSRGIGQKEGSSGKATHEAVSSGEEISPEIPMQAGANKGTSSDEQESHRSSATSLLGVESFPPYWPTTETLEKDTPVLAKWRDKHWYHGHVLAFEKNRYSVAFEDGDVMNVKPTDIIVCDLLAVGQHCLAEREEEEGWQEAAVVTGHHRRGDARMCVVTFSDGQTANLERGKLSLTKEQVNNLVTGVVTAAREDNNVHSPGKPTDMDTEVKIHMVHNTEAQVLHVEVEQETLTSIKPKEAVYEEYEATPALLPTVCTLTSGALPVYAKWLDKHFYPGYVVQQTAKTGKFLIQFEDGTERHVAADDMLVCELLRVGQHVFADDGDGFLAAHVTGHWRKGQETGYKIKFCDGNEVRLERGKVILREEHAAVLMEELRPHGTPKPSPADVSLENLVDGKRSRLSQSTFKSPSRKPAHCRARARSVEKVSVSEQKASQQSVLSTGMCSTGGKRSKRKLEPKYTSTPTPKRRATAPLRETVSDMPSAPQGMVDSPQHARRSPRKSKLELFSTVKGPMPPPGCNIFQGWAFLLTHVEKSDAQKRREKEILRQNDSMELSATDESFVEDEITVPFDKDHLTQQIEHGGGVVLNQFNPEHTKCVLISSTYQRTLKYIFSLAAGIPCVSHVWVKDCCVAGKFQDYKSYLLPAGISIETNSLRECWTKRNPLRSLTLVVSSRDAGFVDTWVKVLNTCGCNIAKVIPQRASQNTIYAVVADKKVEESVLASATNLNIPVVSSEWVIQCLINAQVVDCSHHPRYKHTFELT